MAGIYIHIPFCRHKCLYCDFYSVASLGMMEPLVSAICREAELRESYLSHEVVDTIYFGGGTPSVLSIQEINKIYEKLHHIFAIGTAPEVTLEANPEDLTADYLKQLHELGINRLSMGIQSFCNEHLAYFGRKHSAHQAVDVYSLARKIGFSNISIDLIYGFPDLTTLQWQNNIDAAINLSPEHISAYQLMVEQGSILYKRQQIGQFVPADDDTSAVHYQVLTERLNEAGYVHYELSNFCKTGYESRHNSSYWLGSNYLGLGPAAHSYNGKRRQWNKPHNKRYMDGIARGIPDIEIDLLGEKERYNELIMTRLRTLRGLYRNELDGFSAEYFKAFSAKVNRLIDQGMVVRTDSGWRIPEVYWLVSDGIISELMVD